MLGKVYNTGCNWWCRRFTDIKDIAGGYLTGGIIGALGELYGAFSRFDASFSFSSLTQQEELFLDKWYFQEYESWLKKTIKSVETIYASNSFSKTLIDEINNVILEIELVKKYYLLKKEPTLNLSINGISERNKYIEFSLKPILETLNKKIIQFPLNSVTYTQKTKEFFTINPVVTSYLSELKTFEINELIYKGNSVTNYELTNEQISVDLEHVSETNFVQDVSNSIDEIEFSDESPKEIVPIQPISKKSGLGLFAGILFGTAVLIVATSNDDNKKKQKSK